MWRGGIREGRSHETPLGAPHLSTAILPAYKHPAGGSAVLPVSLVMKRLYFLLALCLVVLQGCATYGGFGPGYGYGGYYGYRPNYYGGFAYPYYGYGYRGYYGPRWGGYYRGWRGGWGRPGWGGGYWRGPRPGLGFGFHGGGGRR